MHSALYWNELRSSFLKLTTDANASFERKIYHMRHLIRCGMYEIGSNTVKSTIIANCVISLQQIAQEAMSLIQAQKSTQVLMASFSQHIVIYLLTLSALALFDYIMIVYKNHHYTEYSRHVSDNSLKYINESLFKTQAAKKSVAFDTSASIDGVKDFYKVTLSGIMAPIELITYFYMLGPSLLFAIAIITVCAGYLIAKIAKNGTIVRRERLDAADKVNGSKFTEFSENLKNLFNLRRKERYNCIDTDFVNSSSKYLFQVASTLICILFVMNGRWDMALMSAQLSASVIAFRRLTKYLDNLTFIERFRSYMEDKHNAMKLQVIKNEYPEYNAYFYSNELGAYIVLNEIDTNLDKLTARDIKHIIKKSHCHAEHKSFGKDINLQGNHLFGSDTVFKIYQTVTDENISETFKDDIQKLIKDWRSNLPQNVVTEEKLLECMAKQRELEQQFVSSEPLVMKRRTKASLYLIATVIVLGFMFTTAPSLSSAIALLPSLSIKLKIGLGLGIIFALHNMSHSVKVSEVNANKLYTAMHYLLLAASLYFAYQLYPVLSYGFVVENSRSIAAALSVTYLSLYTVTDFALQSLGSGIHVLATWASQDAVLLAQQPEKAATFIQGKVEKYMPSMPSMPKDLPFKRSLSALFAA